MKSLAKWLGAGDDTINEMIFEALKSESPGFIQTESAEITFTEKLLPEDSLSLQEWAMIFENQPEENVSNDFVNVLNYLINRGFENPFDYNFYWSPSLGYMDRVIIPFQYQGKIVGNTARKIKEGKPKYLSDQHPHFVFNFDAQQEGQKYIFVVEGPFDALAINGVALLTNEISEQQARIINSIGAEVIVIPDQDKAGLIIFDQAAELGWSVASPNWDKNIKDVAEAVKKYGSIFVAVDAINTAAQGSIKISMAKNKLKNKLERLKNETDN
jgi:hypothetical protein